MGHYCWICGRIRPNERFTGKGHRTHVCKSCQRMPKAERQAIEAQSDIQGFLHQRNISQKNIDRLKELVESPNAETAELAKLVLEVAEFKPHKKRRWKLMRENRPDLFQACAKRFLVPEETFLYMDLPYDEAEEPDPDEQVTFQEPSFQDDDDIPF